MSADTPPMSKRGFFLRRYYVKFLNDSIYWTILAAILVADIALFCYGVNYQVNAPPIGISRILLPAGRGAGLVLELNCALILIPMCHATMTYLRKWTLFKLIVPFNYLRSIHIVLARSILAATILHGGLQTANYISASAIVGGSAVWTMGLRGGVNLFVTGWVLVAILVLIFFTAIKPIRKRLPFESFFYTHHLFIVFYAILLIHGQRGGRLEFWKWYIGPGALYTLDRAYRLFSGNCVGRTCRPVSLRYFPDAQVVRLEIPRMFNFHAGQYADLRIPAISSHQVHPFTIASAPEDETMVFYIKKFGSWTSRLAEIAEDLEKHPLERLYVHVSGPMGAPAQFSFHFDHLLFIGTGIGATPFVSAMRHAAHKCNDLSGGEMEALHEQAVDWAQHHIQVQELDGFLEEDLSEGVSETSVVSWSMTDLSAFEHVELSLHRRFHRFLIMLHQKGTSLPFFLMELWLVLVCILLEAINLIFFDGELAPMTYVVFGLLGLVILSLIGGFVLELAVHGVSYYFRSWKRFASLLDLPIGICLVVLSITAEVLKTVVWNGLDLLAILVMGALWVFLFVRLTLRVGAKNLLQLPHRKVVECVRSVDFVWLNSKNSDAEWMMDDLAHIDSHEEHCSSACAGGMEFRNHFYITREEPDLPRFDTINVYKGRPDWDLIFRNLVQDVAQHPMSGGDTVGVFFCGSPVLGEIIRRECLVQTVKHRKTENPMYFIYHQEVF